MGVIKTIGDKKYQQDELGDWYEVPVKEENATTKVVNGIIYQQDRNGDWYDMGAVKKKEPTSDDIAKRLVGGAGKMLSLLGYGGGVGSSVGQSEEEIKKEVSTKPSFDLKNYNRSFEIKTGMPDIDLGSQSERAQEERNRQKYIRYRDIEENEIKPFEQDVFSGRITKEKIQNFANKPFGKKIVKDIVRQHLDTELTDGALDEEVFRSDVNAERLAEQLQNKFRAQGVESQNQALFDLDNKLYNEIEGLTAKKTYFDAQSEQMRTNEVPFKKIDTNNPTELGQLLRDIEAYGSDYTYSNSKGEIVTPKGISEKIRQKLFFIKANEPIHPEVEQVTDSILEAVNKMDVGWKKKLGYSDAQKQELAQRDAAYIKEGLNYLRDENPGQYKNAINALNEKGELGQLAYGNLINIGKQMDSQKRFQYGEKIFEDSRDFSTPEIRQEKLSHILSEKIKAKGYKNRAAIPDKVIIEAYNELPNELKDDESLQKIRVAEAAPAFGFLPIKQGEGIVKGGAVNSFFRGVTEPLNSIQETFNVLTESPADTYLNSQKLSRGDQKLIDYKTGGVTNKLPSEKGKVFNDIVEGTGQFFTQYLSSVAIGKLIQAPALAVARYGVPAPILAGGEAALKSNINAYVGGFLSTAAQTYGQSYIDFLNKTGDPSKAKLMAFIDATGQSALEVGVLPDVKMVEGFANAWKMGNKNLATDIANAISKGATKSQVFDIAKNFMLGGGKILGKEVFGEEVAQNYANFLTEAIFSPQTAEKRNVLNESWETIKGASVSMAVPILLGGFTGVKSNRQSSITKDALNTLSTNLSATIESLDEGVRAGVINEQQRNDAVAIIEAHSKNIESAPKEDANGNLLSAKKRLEYAYQTTAKQFAKDKAESLPDEIQKEPLTTEIKESEDLQRKIVNGDKIDELEDELSPEDIKAAKILAGADLPGIYAEQAELEPANTLKEISYQAQGVIIDENGNATLHPNGGQSQSLIESGIPQKVIDKAVEMFPNPIAEYVAPKAEPQSGSISDVEDWSRDVESTANALNNIDYIQEDIPDADIRLGVINSLLKKAKTDLLDPEADKSWDKNHYQFNLQLLSSLIAEKKEYENIKKENANRDFTEMQGIPPKDENGKFIKNGKEYSDYIDRAILPNLNKNIDNFKNYISEAYHKSKSDGSNPELVKAVEDLLGKPTQEPQPQPTKAKELADKSVGRYEKKAREIAEKIQKSELPDWLKADLPDGTKKAGASYDQLKKALADAVIEMGKLLDKGVEYSQAIKQAVKDLVSLQGEENRDTIEKGFEKYYTDQTQQQPPIPPQEPPVTNMGTEGDGDYMNKKSVLNRLYNAPNVPEAAKREFEKERLDYVPSSQTEAAELAKSIIDEYGVDKAVRMAESSTLFSGDVRTLIFAEALNRLQGEENAKKWAEVAISLDIFGRDSGRAISAINYFYKNNPYGVILKEEADREDAFDAFSKNKEESWKDYIERIKDEPEFKDFVKQRVSEELKKERIAARAKRIKKVRDIFKKAKDSVKTNNTYATIIPPHILETAIEAMELLYEAGESVAHIISTGINHITDKLGNNNWDSEKFRGEWEEKLKDEQTKSELTDEEKKQKVLDKFRNKLKGLNDKQRDIVVRKMFDKVVKSGALEYEDLRNIIAETLGYGKLSETESKKLKELVEKRNSVVDAAKKVQDERTKESLTEYTKTQLEAGKAARELQDLLWNNPDVLKRMVSIMQLNTLGIPALINNPVYNFFNQLGVRFPVGLINTAADSIIAGMAKLTGKNFVREYNIIAGQKEFWEKLGVGSKEAASQVLTGLNRMDYMQKEVYGNQIRPFRAWRDLMLSAQGKKNLSNKQIWDKALQAIPGIPAEIVARLLNVGDKPMRFASEGAQAAAFAKALNLKDIDRDIFIEFPREEAYRVYKAQGLSDEKAAQMADYVKEAIIKEGQRSTFQQDNLLNDVLTRAAGVFGGKDSGASTLAKTLVVSPYIKIPSNAFWSMYNLINPEIAMLQAIYHGTKASGFNKNGDVKNAKLQLREARYWAAHGVVGLGYKLLFISLVAAGVFVPSPDDESKKERSAQSLFELGGSVNIDKLLAILSFRDPSEVKDGTLVSNRWFGQVGAVGNIIARRWFDATPEQRENMTDFWNIALSGFELDALKEAENGVFANSSSLLQALGTGDFSRYGINTLNLFANIIQPASTAQLERSVINEVPQAKGDNFLDKVNQSFAQRSVLYRNLFNVKIDKKTSMWGEPIPKGGNFLTRMFGISKVNPQLDGRPMYDDYLRTSDAGFLPPDVQNKLNGAKLTNSQYNDLQRYVGNARKMYALPFINGDMQMVDGRAYSQLSDDEKKSMLSGLYDKGRKAGLERFYTDYPEFRPKEETGEEKQKKEVIRQSLKQAE